MNSPAPASAAASSPLPTIAFIGGGNMASAIIGGLIHQGHPASQIEVVEPYAPTRETLLSNYGLTAMPEAGPALQRASIVVWAVKPQTFKDAAAQAKAHTQGALHLSVAAGIRSDSIAQWLATERIVRTMPNTPALVGKGMSALYARPAVDAKERAQVEAIMASTGEFLWVETEKQLDAVTALSGSGPAYVFYFLEAMTRAGARMGLSAQQAHQLAVGTFVGASELARRSDEAPAVLRERVTSKGGTTYAALQCLDADGVGAAFERAMEAARQRADELGNEFGG
nr:pyrroline-5-carboxylate reductase [uncultured Acidovorax sp.]